MIEYSGPKEANLTFDKQIEIFREAGMLAEIPDHADESELTDHYLDFDQLTNPDISEQSLEALGDWLGRGADLEQDIWLNPDAPIGGRTETLAWYQSMTYSGHRAGIFITTRGIQLYGWRNLTALRSLGSPPRDAARWATLGAISQLLTHEIFHYHVEWMAFRLDASFGKISPSSSRYQEYSKNKYAPSKKSGLGPLEEALASAFEFRNFPTSFVRGVKYPPEIRRAFKSAIESGYQRRPPGYNEAERFLTTESFKVGVGELVAMLDGRPNATINWLLPQLELQHGRLTNMFLKSWRLVEADTSQPQQFPMKLTVPDRALKKYLSNNGFAPTHLGNGSHEVWKKPGSAMITIPHRKDQAGHEFLRSVARALNLKNVHELLQNVRSM